MIILKKQNLKTATLGFLSLLLISGLSACGEPTYPSDKIPESVEKLCKEEYGFDVKAKTVGETLWVYLPIDDLFNAQGEVDESKEEEINNAFFSMSRVFMSSDRNLNLRFYVLVASEIKYIGLDLIMVGYLPDIKRVRFLDISRADYHQRILNERNLNEEALGDYEGKHVNYLDISLDKFLAEQIVQRIDKKFSEDEELEQYFKPGFENWYFDEKDLVLDISLQKLKPDIPEYLDPQKVILKIATYVLRNYRFKDFTGLKVLNPLGPGSTYLTRKEVYAYR